MTTEQAPRRGLREPIETGVHRAHRVSCPSTTDWREFHTDQTTDYHNVRIYTNLTTH